MILPSRRTFAVGAAASVLTLAGAAQASEGDAMSIGAASAPVHLIEYASATCPHCAHFHEQNWAQLKRDYIDTGRVRLTLSEMLTPPPAVALAMFQVARCGDADADEYFRRMGILFASQQRIFETGTVGGVRNELIAIGGEFGLTQAQVMAALTDTAGVDRINRLIAAAGSAGVTSTPTFFLNGQRQANDFQTPANMVRILDAAIAAR